MASYVVDVSRLLEHIGSDKTIEDSVVLGTLEMRGEQFEFTGPVSFSVTITNTGAGLVLSGTVEAKVTTSCSRCLEIFDLPIEGSIEGFFVTPEHAAGLPEEQEYDLVEDEKIDMLPAIRTAIALEFPFVPVHAEDCKGICPGCGKNLNCEQCECARVSEDSPFRELEKLLAEEHGEGRKGEKET